MSEESTNVVFSDSGPDADRPKSEQETASEGDSDPLRRETVWYKIQENIKERLGLERFGIWFKQTELMDFDDSKLVIGVPNVIIKQYLDQKYRVIVEDAAKALLDSEVDVEFDVAPKLLRKTRADDEALPDAALPEKPKKATDEIGPTLESQEERGRSSHKQFEELVVVDSNRLAFLAAQELARRETPQFNFVVVIGSHGAGKTALLRAAEGLAQKSQVLGKTQYLRAESWSNDYYHALKKHRTRSFRQHYRSCDFLVMDEMQFFQGKPAAQEEFVHTAKTLKSRGGRLLVSSALHPDDFEDVKPEFIHLLSGALWVDLQMPTKEEMTEIASALAKQMGCQAEPSALQYIVQQNGVNLCRLEGVIRSVTAYASLIGEDRLGLAETKKALSATGRARMPRPTLEKITAAVLESFSVTEQELRGKTRAQKACRARQAAMYLGRELTGESLSDIGRFFGGRTHSTVKHSVEQADAKIQEAGGMAAAMEKCRRILGVS
ncbi:MAG: hypothetical protein KGZ25_02910 [Planctomycetes bacterium]|nr:hypothetical protein [Planctomycetota bacterium]